MLQLMPAKADSRGAVAYNSSTLRRTRDAQIHTVFHNFFCNCVVNKIKMLLRLTNIHYLVLGNCKYRVFIKNILIGNLRVHFTRFQIVFASFSYICQQIRY